MNFGDSAVLAHFMLNEKLQRVGVLGCILCIVGSTVIILHAPEERSPSSVEQIWGLATQPSKFSILLLAIITGLSFDMSSVMLLHNVPNYQ